MGKPLYTPEAQAQLQGAQLPPNPDGVSFVPTVYIITCRVHGSVHITQAEYVRQLSDPDTLWVCPLDGNVATITVTQE